MKKTIFLSLLSLVMSISYVCGQTKTMQDPNMIFDKVARYIGVSQAAKAIPLLESAQETIFKDYGEESRESVICELLFGLSYEALGEYAKAAERFLKSAECSRKVYEKTNEREFLLRQGDAYTRASSQYIELAEYEKAIHYQKKGIDIIAREAQGSEAFWEAYMDLGDCYLYVGDYKMAFAIYTKCKDFYKSAGIDYARKLALVYSRLGVCCSRTTNCAASIEYALEALRIGIDILQASPANIFADYVNLGLSYYQLGDLSQSYHYYTKAQECYNEIEEPSPTMQVRLGMLYNNMGMYYRALGKYKTAINYYNKSKEIKAKTVGEYHPSYAATLTNIGHCYEDFGEYNYAKECLEKAKSIEEKIYGKDSPQLVKSLLNLVSYHSTNIQESIEQYISISDVVKKHYGELHEYYALCIGGLSESYRRAEEYAKAHTYGLKSAEIIKSIYGENSLAYADELAHIATIYATEKKYEEAQDYYRRAMSIIRDICGEQNEKYYEYNRKLFNTYYYQGNKEYCKEAILQLANSARAFILDAMTFLTIEERTKCWSNYQYVFLGNLPYYSLYDPKNHKLLEATYDGLLLGKGFLLNGEIEQRKIINESNDPQLIALYDKLTRSKFQLNRLYEQPKDERPISVQDLEEEVRRLGRELQQRCQEFKDQTQIAAVTMKDVQLSLKDSDIAIEFMLVDIDDDDVRYCALTLKPGYEAPRLVELFKQEELDALKAKYEAEGAIYSSSQLYKLVWKPLAKELKGVKNIYFSPVGDLHEIAIEYANSGENSILSKMNIYRLSSTRELAVSKLKKPYKKSAIFGGFKFSASADELNIETNTNEIKEIDSNTSISVDSLNIRGAVGGTKGVRDLPGTLIEVQKIAKVLESTNIKTSLATGANGTETAFKKLTGQRNDIIHIATHGFYWEGELKYGANRESEVAHFNEDKAMTRSGLLFSGVNNMLRNTLPKLDGADDGILTAAEISRMELRGTELLVLSACQTGLGNVNGEGVFGLQRGFKKAGVNTILMSLWEVDDIATQMLMDYFYENISSGMSKNAALRDAQNRLRACKEYDFSSPYYWAAFILLDGIN